MIELKFHVYSIAGIFLALAIGMIIGNAMNRDTKLTAENNKIMKRYAETVHVLKTDLENAKASEDRQNKQLDADEAFISSVTEVLNKDILKDLKISIVSFGNDASVTGCIRKGIEQAGGKVLSVTVIKTSYLNEPKNDDIKTLLTETGQGEINDSSFIQTKVAGLFAGLLAEDNTDTVLAAFSKSKMFSLSGDYSGKNDAVVLLNFSDKNMIKNTQAVGIFADTLKKKGLFIAGADTSGKTDTVSVWENEQIPYIDNADSNLGAFSLTKILEQKQGKYGLNRKLGRSYPDPE